MAQNQKYNLILDVKNAKIPLIIVLNVILLKIENNILVVNVKKDIMIMKANFHNAINAQNTVKNGINLLNKQH